MPTTSPALPALSLIDFDVLQALLLREMTVTQLHDELGVPLIDVVAVLRRSFEEGLVTSRMDTSVRPSAAGASQARYVLTPAGAALTYRTIGALRHRLQAHVPTSGGVPLTGERLRALAIEAEHGYDAATLRPRSTSRREG